MKKLIVSLMVLLYCFIVSAKPVDETNAKLIAEKYYKFYISPKILDYSISDIIQIKSNEKITIYCFNFNSGGFVLVSANDATIPILGYSSEGRFDYENCGNNTKLFMENYSDQITYCYENNISNDISKREWESILSEKKNKETEWVGALLTTKWNQGCYYNGKCPSTSSGGDCGRVWTGCGATAMGQILKYHKFPTTGNGSHGYTHPTYGYLSANFSGTTYSWNNMPITLSSSSSTTYKDAVSTLLYHCGVAVDMNYGNSSSSSFISDIRYALVNYFKYQNTTTIKYKSDYTNSNWSILLRNNIDGLLPVFYMGTKNDGTGGHFFVVDGYNVSGSYSDYFHINWGWGGSNDGNYYLSDLTPGTNNYNYYNAAIVNIRPNNTTLPSFLIANYSFATNAQDETTLQSDFVLLNTPLTSGAIYCNGIYWGNTNYCHANSPQLNYLNTNNFQISFDFKIPSYTLAESYFRPVIVMGGIGFCVVKPANQYPYIAFKCNGTYHLWQGGNLFIEGNTWYSGKVTYNGSTAKLYYNSTLLFEKNEQLSFSSKVVSVTDHSLSSVFKGYLKNLRVYSNNNPFSNISDNTTENNALFVYPNPASEALKIKLNKPNYINEGYLSIYDLSGQILLRKIFENEIFEIDISVLSKGIYIIEYENNGVKMFEKFIKY